MAGELRFLDGCIILERVTVTDNTSDVTFVNSGSQPVTITDVELWLPEFVNPVKYGGQKLVRVGVGESLTLVGPLLR